MKKIYLCAIALSVGSISFGQTAKVNAIPLKDNGTKITKSTTQNPQDKGITLWSNDFTTPGDWTIASNGDDWVIGTGIAPSGSFAISPLTSTSGGNFAMFDSDLLCSGNQDATLTIASPITVLGSTPFVSIQFEQYYRKYVDSTFVGVSTNGGATWTDFKVNGALGTNDYNSGDANSNPNTVSVNISSVAGNQASVLIRFHYMGGCDYAWMVDDVKIIETDANDLVASNGYYGSALVPYTRVPVAQIQPVDFSIEATNVGSADQTGTVLTADVNSGLFTGTSTPMTVVTGATDSLFTTTQWTPGSTPGTPYTISLTVTSDFTDATPGNNTISFPPLEVTPFIYAMDDYSATPGNGGGEDGNAPGSFEFEAGNVYDVVTAATAYAIDVVIGTNTVVGTGMEVVLYDLTTGSFVEVDRSTPIAIASGDLGTVMTIGLPNTPSLTAGNTYFAAVHALGGTEFFYGSSGTSPDNNAPGGAVSYIFYPDMQATTANYYTTQTPMVRLNFNPAVGINNVEANNTSFNVYPNPSTGDFNINLNNDMGSAVSLTVKNVVGQTIINKEIAINGNQVETISLAGYDKGVYFLTINNETVKLIVE